MIRSLRDLLRRNARAEPTPRPRIVAEHRPARLYAIGDIHGCLAELQALERLIVADAADVAGEKWIVTLGDYIDRGPASAQVLDHLLAPPPAGFRRICLAGNHEQMLLDFLVDPARNQPWLKYGGWETAHSYGLATTGNAPAVARILAALIPKAHLDWLRGLPTTLAVPGFLFVHAGIRPGIPLDGQADIDLLWIRDPFLAAISPSNSIVVHGHTPGLAPVITPYRIDIDTTAFATGRLTALRLDASGATSFLSTPGRPSPA